MKKHKNNKGVENITDSYVKSLLKKEYGFSDSEITQLDIDEWREQLTYKRELRTLTKQLRDSKKHFELTGITKINAFGVKLHRIRCTKALKDVKVGDFGGWVQNAKNLSGEAWAYDEAEIFGDALVSGQAEIRNKSLVYGRARVLNSARVLGSAKVYANAKIKDKAEVFGKAEVSGRVIVLNNAKIFDTALVSAGALVCDNAKVFGNSWISAGEVSGNAEVFGDTIL